MHVLSTYCFNDHLLIVALIGDEACDCFETFSLEFIGVSVTFS